MKLVFGRSVLAVLVACVFPVACNAITGMDNFAVDPSWNVAGAGGQGQAGAGGMGGDGLGCTTVLTCPGETNACQTRTCVAGVCQLVIEQDGKLVPGQIMGDCFRLECDGKGNVHSVLDVQDLPDDGLTCVQDQCGIDGTPSHTPAPMGVTCAQSGGKVCNGMGQCVQCNSGPDCGVGGSCSNGICVPAQCTDMTKNGSESDIDCGGPQCAACPTDYGCGAKADCQSNVCIAGTCRAPTCSDATRNGNETDVDCGGPLCPDCDNGKICLVSGDCTSGVCTGSVCQAATCTDSIKNGNEADVDCGGKCPGCAAGLPCNANLDCASEVCRNNICTSIVQIDAGTGHACALLGDGTVFCWGANGGGQIGDGTTVAHPTAVMVPGLSGVTQISTGVQNSNVTLNGHTCARTSGGVAYCWGRNANNQIGDGTTVDVYSPKVIVAADVAQVAAGRAHTCVRLTSGAVQCWGFNATGQVGNGTTLNVVAPEPAIAGLTAKNIHAGTTHTCAILTTGELSCWGGGATGQLGKGNTANSSVPGLVPGSANMLSVEAGYGFTCSIDVGGVLRCWGDNTFGELGLGNMTIQKSPQIVPDVTGAVGVTCGSNNNTGAHTCAVRADGALFCFGLNASGQLGLGDTTNRLTPQAVSLPPVAEVAAGYQFTCARLVNGPVRCWGRNDTSQLGTGQATTMMTKPVPVVFP